MALAGAVLVTAAAVWLVTSSNRSAPATAAAPTVDDGRVPTAPAPTAGPATTSSLGIVPVSVAIPTLHVRAAVTPVGVSSGGVLGVPADPLVIGWWSGGPRPGAAAGTAVLAGHVNYDGVEGAFAHLWSVEPGDAVVVTGAGGVTESFTVTGARSYAKTGLPAAAVFDQAVSGRLVLVTCGGPFDAATGHYLDNVVVYAVPDA